jgi:nondiscriminating aspartyl-tRNA synthetase
MEGGDDLRKKIEAEIEKIAAEIKAATNEFVQLKKAQASQEKLEQVQKVLKDLKTQRENKERELKERFPDAVGAVSKSAARKAKQQAAKGKGTEEAQETTPTNYGVLPLIRSSSRTGRKPVFVRNLNASLVGQHVLVRARLHTTRGKGKICFLILRQQAFTVQAVLEEGGEITSAMLKFVRRVDKESIVDVEGVVTQAEVHSCSQKDVELRVRSIFVVSSTHVKELPLLIEDASRPLPLQKAQKREMRAIQKEIDVVVSELEALKKSSAEGQANQEAIKAKEAELEALIQKKSAAQKFVIPGQKTRLNNRIIDLRTAANQAIFRIQSGVCELFREYLLSQSFVEIHSPKIISAASEGGAEVFQVKYFEGAAYLAQSPQFYKQMAICADMERVFEIGPVFRAENSFTHRHLTEFVGLDLEMAFYEHYHEVLDVLDNLFLAIFDGLAQRYRAELEVVRVQYPFEDLKYTRPSPRITYAQAVQMLRKAGETIGDFEDLSTPLEKKLGQLVKAEYGVDFYILDKFPLEVRPFYTMPDPADPRYANAYDLMLRTEEICSGAQRVHDPEVLVVRAREKGITDLRGVQAYIDAFKYGAPPHAGGGVGLERVVMLYLGLNNIRKTSLFPRDPARITP